MDKLFEFVTQRPLTELVSDPPHCPACQSERVLVGGTEETLVGYFGPINPNHTWQLVDCLDCHALHTRETKSGNVWYTYNKRQSVREGMPCCFETYTYTHHGCGGTVTHHYTSLDGSPLTSGILTAQLGGPNPGRQYRTFYRCETCQTQIEYDAEYWRPTEPPEAP